jgi:hypothetical protein
MDFGISNPNPGPYFDDAFEEPPPPMISSEGLVVQDITQKFLAAAASKFSRQRQPALDLDLLLMTPTTCNEQQPWNLVSS